MRLRSFLIICVVIAIVVLAIKMSDNKRHSDYSLYYQDRFENSDGSSNKNVVKSFKEALTSLDSMDSSTGYRHRSAVSWLPKEKKKVLFVMLETWKRYHGLDKSSKTGEYYASATWDYALKQHGFEVDFVSQRRYNHIMTREEIASYYRIFLRSPRWHRFYDHFDILCKVRPMYFYGGFSFDLKRGYENPVFRSKFAETQVLSANAEDKNTFMGYFPHNILLENPPRPERKKVGLLYGKKPEYFEGKEDVIKALLDNGFELHSTCKDSSQKVCPFPPEVIRHGFMTPGGYASLMKQYSFMLGFNMPKGSPSPLVGLSYGVAFLNPLRKGSQLTQHKALSRLGFPYSYIVDLKNETTVVQAAQWSHKYRFSSYVPPPYRVESLVSRMRGLLEDDSFCFCPNPNFGNHTNGLNIDPDLSCKH